MVSIDVRFSQLSDENTMPVDVESEYYCHDLLKPSKVTPLHVVFGLRGVLAKQGKSFEPYTLALAE